MAKPRSKSVTPSKTPKKTVKGRGSVPLPIPKLNRPSKPLDPKLQRKFEQRKGVKVETMKGSLNV